ncbi:SERPINE1 mRNA-binding protein 1 [Parasteatoda tepidariorum]|uniref:SERPINE1 mRNA-binding protein 1 n=1 Tax=Parasteatoda tepidariorum TaxID=114398 RepID=UPI00077FD199|nr:plasminogen activator inhibitor 1 RNA-binding protein [Parasteatoda tepidariorum]
METVPHGIGVQNRYALFYDECLDPLEILKQTEEQKSKKKTEKPVKKAAKTSPPAPLKKPTETVATKAVKIQDQDSASKPRGKPALQSKVSNQNDFRENVRNRDDNYFGAETREREGGNSEFRRGRGGFRGARGGDAGGGRRGRGFFPNSDNRNRRVFDRKSGSDKSGVKSVEKRDGAGSNNWGDIRSDINQRRDGGWDDEFEGEPPRQELGGNVGEDTEFGKVEEGLKNDSLDNSETKENDQITEEEQQIQDAMKEMTLDEWKKEQEAKRVVPKYNLRKPGEGEDEKQWKKGYVLKKKPKEDDEEEEEDDEDDEYARRGPQKVLLDIQFNYADSRRGNRGRGRGGRGGPRSGPRDNANRDSPREDRPPRDGRGGRGGGGPKVRGGQQAAPRVDDFNDFPSLVNA